MQPEDNQNYNQPYQPQGDNYMPQQPQNAQQQYQEEPHTYQVQPEQPQQYQPTQQPQPQTPPPFQSAPQPVPQPAQPMQQQAPQYPTAFNTQPNDPLSNYMDKVKRNPGKSLFIGAVALSLLSTLFPWVGTLFTASSYNYFGLITRNMFAILYLFALLFIVFNRYTLWFSMENFSAYKKQFEYIEVLCAGGILMFVFALGVYDNIQIGLIMSVIANIGIVSYLTYLRFYKK